MAEQRNPFTSDDPNANPWSGGSDNAGGPAYGNAYEDTNNNSSWNYGSMRMPEPSVPNRQSSPRVGTMNSSYSRNAWENDKTEVPAGDNSFNAASPSMANANANPYQFAGTRYGNTDTSGNAYSAAPPEPTQSQVAPGPQQTAKPDTSSALPPVWHDDLSSRPSKSRLGLRIVQLIACIGSIGFAAGASSYSHQPVPFDNKALFYFLWAWAIISLFWVFFHIFIFLSRSIRGGKKISRIILILVDLIFAVIWGVCVIVEIAQYKCPPGQHYGWCDFYNVSIFWGMLAFVAFAITFFWDIFGACARARR
ncbi:unnamed protein product [Umbelopsis sp. WA50703]